MNKQEAAELFVTETFHKADMARHHAGRETLHVKDLRFSRFMTPESLWVVPVEKVWEPNSFFAPGVHNNNNTAVVRRTVLYHDINKIQKKMKNKKKAEPAQQQDAQNSQDVEDKEEAEEEEAADNNEEQQD